MNIFLKWITDNKDALSIILGSGAAIAILGVLWKLITWTATRIRAQRVGVDTFPFEVIRPNKNIAKTIYKGNDKDPLADQNIPYQTRSQGKSVRRDLEQILFEKHWLLITGRTGLGKTREAVNLMQSLNNEGWTILNFTREEWCDKPSHFPYEKIGTDRKIVFFLDDLNRKCYSSKIELGPHKEDPTHPLTVPLQMRLQRMLEAYETFCGKSEIYVIATARDEKTVIFDDEPTEWDKLAFERYSEFWGRFKRYFLPDPEDATIVNLLEQVTRQARIQAEKSEFGDIAKRNDRTFANIITNLITTRNEKQRFSKATFRETLEGTWRDRYANAVSQYGKIVSHIYYAIGMLRKVHIPITHSTARFATMMLVDKRNFVKPVYQWYVWFVIRNLQNTQKILTPRDGQIEAAGTPPSWKEYTKQLGDILISILPHDANQAMDSVLHFCILLSEASVYQIDLAEYLMKKAIAIYPSNLKLWMWLATHYHNLRRIEDAISSYNKVIELDPNSSSSWHGKSHIYQEEGNYDEAIASLKKAIVLNPNDSSNWFCLGRMNSLANKHQEAVSAFEKAAKIDPRSPTTWANLGKEYQYLDLKDKAAEANQKAITLLPDSSLDYHDLGHAYFGLNIIEDSIKSFRRAIELVPQSGSNYICLANVYLQLSQTDNAISVVIQGIEHVLLDFEKANLQNSLGEIYYDANNFENAVVAFGNATKLEPQKPQFWINLGKSFDKLDKHEDTKNTFEHAVNLDPENPDTFHQLAHAQVSCKDSEAAINSFKKAIELNPNDETHYYCLGNYYFSLEQFENATDALEKSTEKNSQNANTWNSLGNVYRNQKKHDKAIQAYKKVIECGNKDANVWNKLGNMYLLTSNLKDALTAHKNAVKLSPEQGYLHASLVGILRRLNMEAEASKEEQYARSLIEKENEYNRACFESICGNTEEALQLLKIALEQKQTNIEWVRQDPDLDFIREDIRFKKLVGLY